VQNNLVKPAVRLFWSISGVSEMFFHKFLELPFEAFLVILESNKFIVDSDCYLHYFLLWYPDTLVFINSITLICRLVPIFTLLHSSVGYTHKHATKTEIEEPRKVIWWSLNGQRELIEKEKCLKIYLHFPAWSSVIFFKEKMENVLASVEVKE